eukprot:TRINITY_DN102545_c0_g1_i1.p1 TRINITY_DN102545_c0_g1~~TRINITY_DN102545_c0_g1_i1.p1  ORF type:complete len:1712 (-),score=248.63 TRINITY_DN102545_c0_g1_i1:118-5253(-)
MSRPDAARRLAVLVVAKAIVALATPDSWLVSCSANCNGKNRCQEVCSGEQLQRRACPDQADCPAQLTNCPAGEQPKPCKFTEWTEWSDPLGCTGLCMRTRNISQMNSCGGPACEGALQDAKYCESKCGDVTPNDCAFHTWGPWSTCGAKAPMQRERTRAITQASATALCQGSLEETEDCGTHGFTSATDCEFGDWMAWSACSQKCGGGETGRLRTILKHAQNGGRLCFGSLEEKVPCNTAPCAGIASNTPKDCDLGAWTNWTACNEQGQKVRTRPRLQPATSSGKACEGAVKELLSCVGSSPVMKSADCALSDWQEWELCDQHCGGGQTMRHRTIAKEAALGGRPCFGGLQETMACNTMPCSLYIQPCRPSQWTEWGACSTTCGPGSASRSRSYSDANPGGQGCTLPLMESKACQATKETPRAECVIQDCELSAWTEWKTSACTCMGGISERDRHITKQATIGGKPCDLNNSALLEVGPCPKKECPVVEHCTDGQWGDWGGWSECTKSCRGGFRTSTRRIVLEANKCGKPAQGLTTQVASCNEDVPCVGVVDCEITDWSAWSACDQPCSDVRERTRDIKVHAKDGGKPCGSEKNATALGQIEHCPPADGQKCESPEPDGCNFSDWSNWTSCSATCGGGQTSRQRKVLPGPDGSVAPCQGSLQETKACGQNPCGKQVDCEYGDWSTWGNCTKCGGQQHRSREIKTRPVFGGAECEAAQTEQTQPCPRQCGDDLFWCVWTEWGNFSDCLTTCGVGIRIRKKKTVMTKEEPEHYLSRAASEKECDGEVLDVKECPDLPACDACTPQDCELSDWTDWSQPQCEGFCTRSRKVAKPHNKCGRPCEGSLNGTKPCTSDCQRKDCKLGAWTPWTNCSSNLGQKYQWREVLEEGANGGRACSTEALNLTGSCLAGPGAPVDCTLATWSEWGACSAECGQGQQSRSRAIAVQASKGGQACLGALSEVQGCEGKTACTDKPTGLVDCQLSPWSLWLQCEHNQQLRNRRIQHAAQAGGKACKGELQETRGCGETGQRDRNCVFSTWSDWTLCPKSCGGAQQHRSRIIEAHAKGEGLQCSGTMLDTQPCGEGSCPGAPSSECQYSDWSQWGACSKSCGEGFKERSRNITAPALAGTEGCKGAARESAACSGKCSAAVDCQWHDWSAWSPCVKAPSVCGVGYKRRNRSIAVMPALGGALCDPRHIEEVMPVANCGGQPECCIDGQWDDWQAWGPCTASCGTGSRKRIRAIKIKETYCGKPAVGSNVEYGKCSAKPCSADADCVFGAWSAPTHCSSPCHGHQILKREIAKNSTGKGNPCEGTLSMARMCNPAEGQAEPAVCANKESLAKGVLDCVMEDWSDWSGCSATCEKGYQQRARHVQVSPQRGGKSCPSSLKEIRSCNKGVTCFPERANCIWEAWTDWSGCDAFSKETRTRGIAQHAAEGGLDCNGDFRSIRGCENSSSGFCPTSWYNCSWSLWSVWSPCSKSCGRGGMSTRKRQLQVGKDAVPAPVAVKSGPPEVLSDVPQYQEAHDADKSHSEPFDCDAGVRNWKLGWSGKKKQYCCDHHQIGCQGNYEDEIEPFDCTESVTSWRTAWSDDMKIYCCKHHQVGCEEGSLSSSGSMDTYGLPTELQTSGFQQASAPVATDFGAADVLEQAWDESLPSLQAKVREVEGQRMKELRTSFALGCACLVAVAFVGRIRRLPASSLGGAVGGVELPQYNAVPQNF